MEKTLCCHAHFSMFNMRYDTIMRKAFIFVKEKIEKNEKEETITFSDREGSEKQSDDMKLYVVFGQQLADFHGGCWSVKT